jgi:DNA-binding MarR family transcriptional regulator
MSEVIIQPKKRYEVSGYNIERTSKLMKLAFSRMLQMHEDIPITVDQWVILQLVEKHQILSQQEIAELSLKDAPTITRIIDLLVQKELLLRSPDLNDRRKFNISITSKGIKVYNLVIPILHAFRNEAYDGITDHELSALDSIMNKIFINLSKPN